MFKLVCDEKDITYGQRYLLNLLEERKFSAFCRDNSLKFEYTYTIAIGGNLPQLPLIYKLRNIIHPVLWFYTEQEDKPEERLYKDYHPENTITNDGEQWDYTQSIGFRKFQKIENLKSWSIENGFSYVSMWIIATGRRNPSYAKIKQLKNFVYPSDWFFNE